MYEDENEEIIKGCTKIYPKHQRLSPGLVVVVCKHKVCYGFQILRRKESTITIFNLLLTLFEKPPRTIIYDNACNLHNTCIIRLELMLEPLIWLLCHRIIKLIKSAYSQYS